MSDTTTTRTIAGLPMYDWPEVAGDVDELWREIRHELTRREIEAPEQLSRPDNLEKIWRDPAMLVGQVCALNPVRDGLGEVEPLGTLVYEPPAGLPDPEPGVYYSVLVAHRSVAPPNGPGLAALRDARIASNGTDSLSGYWSLGHHVRDLTASEPLFGPALFTGSHRESVRAVAARDADVAAIDVHSWRLALEFEPDAAAELAVLGTTDPTPGVVLVTAWERAAERDVLNDAIEAAVAGLRGSAVLDALRIRGYRRRTLPEFHVVSSRVAQTARRDWHR
ncbi:MAG: PhnD/SsuA/transferrin family substrate-binding protein [Ilumatobacteraceae bacterium]